MKIGDKVRFLSEVGGGVVAGFQGKNIVLVEDEDGFQVPTAITDVVVVDSDNYDVTPSVGRGSVEAAVEVEPADRPVTFRPKPEERRGGDVLSVYLAFVPVDSREMTRAKFEAYLVNDSNYYVNYLYLSAEGASWHLRSTDVVEPNTKLFIEELDHDALNELERVSVQILAYKRDKTFMIKPAVDVTLRIDTMKFYKLHAFRENEFFEQPALVYTIVENDKPARPLVIDAKKLKQEMTSKITTDSRKPAVQPARKDNPDEPVVVDLHASELLDSTSGLSSGDILNYQIGVFRDTMDKLKSKRGTKIIFIHGKGEGVLRQAIIRELNYRYKNCPYQDASFREYGYGATQVTIK